MGRQRGDLGKKVLRPGLDRGTNMKTNSPSPPLFAALCALCALCVSTANTREALAQKKPSGGGKSAAKPSGGKQKSLSGTGFTLQEHGGGLGVEAMEYLGTPKTEAAVKKALKYLADNQGADGSWSQGGASSDVGIV